MNTEDQKEYVRVMEKLTLETKKLENMNRKLKDGDVFDNFKNSVDELNYFLKNPPKVRKKHKRHCCIF